MRWQVGGVGVGIAVGWNIAILGPIATRLTHDYGVGLTTIALRYEARQPSLSASCGTTATAMPGASTEPPP